MNVYQIMIKQATGFWLCKLSYDLRLPMKNNYETAFLDLHSSSLLSLGMI